MDEADSKKKDEKSKAVAPEDVNWSGGIAKHGCTDIICLLSVSYTHLTLPTKA